MKQVSLKKALKAWQEILGISVTAIRKLVGQLVDKNYVEKNPKDSSWRVIITPSN